MLKSNAVPSRNPEAIWRNIDGEVIVYLPHHRDKKSPVLRIFNDTGSRIWELIDIRTDIKRIAETISEEFDIAFNDAISDIKEFLSYLKKIGLIIWLKS